MSCSPRPEIIFGASTVGGGGSFGNAFPTQEATEEPLTTLKECGITRIDTAAMYPPMAPGESERLLGLAGALQQGFAVDTKIMTTMEKLQGTLTPEKIQSSVATSRQSLGADGKGTTINVLYCHWPDLETPLEQQAATCDEQYKKGFFSKAWMEISNRKGYVKPTVYQGLYNVIQRESEVKLFPTLRKHGISFTAYLPLAGGFLSGKLTAGNAQGPRFDPEDPAGGMMLAIYDKKEMHSAVIKLNETIFAMGISSIEASLRWIFYHSVLGPKDGVIIGASRVDQIKSNVESIAKGPLPAEVVQSMDSLWQIQSDA
ncbi:Aldehyde reductase [Fusarium sp. LHS14.1]|nr:Aldehyde reductase [Fusarium sp. LHS14.1]